MIGWSYDAAGNLLSDGTTTRSYDALSRMVAQAGTSYTYNGDGVLVSDGTTTYAQDLAAPLSQVLSDGTANYVYGHERLRALGGPWYVGDALGSVRQTLDDAGGVLATTNYDPWGTPQGTLSAPFGFTGELHSAGQVYLRARWYAPGNGTFPSRDPFAGWAERPDSLHPYIYAGNNPIIWVDPYGKTWYLTFGEAERLANSLKDQSDAFSTQSLGWSEIAIGSPLLADMLVGDHIGGSWPVGRTRIPKLSGVLTVGTTFNAFCAAHQSSTFGAMAELIRDANRRSDFHGDNSPGIALAYVPGQGTGPGGGRLYALNRETGKLLVHSTNFIETHKIPRDMYLGQVVSSQRPVRGYSFRGDILPISYAPILLGPQYTLADPLMVQHGLVMPPISTYPPGHPEIFDPGQTAQYEERVPSQTIR